MSFKTGSKQATSLSIWLAMLSIYIVWGSTYLAIRFAIETLPPFLMAAARFLIAGVILYIFTRLRGAPKPTKIEWRSASIVGLFLLLGGNGLVVWAEQRVASSVAALMIATVPLWIILLDTVRPGGQRPNKITILGVLGGMVGLVLLVGPSGLGGERVDLIGAGSLVVASLLWSIGSLYSRTARLPDTPLLGTGMEMLAGGAGLLILGTILGEWSQVNFTQVSARSMWSLGYLIAFGSLVGFASYTWLLRVAPTPLVSTYAYVNPMVAIFLGNLLANEPLTPRVLMSAAVIIGSVALITAAQPVRRRVMDRQAAPVSTGDD
ncbi:MAG: EamA family transporter [Chloroflexi bacterium]|nr:MAG: EamA family transporter [Chloroflexota bacterium]